MADSIAATVRKAIEGSHLSLYRLAERTGVDHGQLSRFQRGERSIRLDTLDRLAGELGLTVSADTVSADTVSADTAKGDPPQPRQRKDPATMSKAQLQRANKAVQRLHAVNATLTGLMDGMKRFMEGRGTQPPAIDVALRVATDEEIKAWTETWGDTINTARDVLARLAR